MARLVNSKDISPLYTVLVVEFTPSRSKAIPNARTEGKVFCESTHSGASRSTIGREREFVGRVCGYSRDDEAVAGEVPCSASVSFAVREHTQSSGHPVSTVCGSQEWSTHMPSPYTSWPPVLRSSSFQVPDHPDKI